jgi:gliding motility-associated-like protein
MQRYYFVKHNPCSGLIKIFFTYHFVFFISITFAQKQANIWYFGNRVGLDFNQLPPLPLLNSDIRSEEGSAVISDNNGKLLFYTNGQRLLNRKHVPMKSNGNLLGDISSTDNTIVVPSPGNDSIYYLFTIGSAFQLNKGLRYNIININGDDGFGEVINNNIQLEPAAFEKIAAVRHCNNKDVWIVIHKWDSNEYHAYLLTSAGVNPNPVVSNSGLFITGDQSNSIGTLKFSIDGKQLAAVHSYENNVIELMDFDNFTGSLTSPVVFSPDQAGIKPLFTGVYAAEFSPNGNLLYVSDNMSLDDPGTLFQFDISSHNAAVIIASKQVIVYPSLWFAGDLQIGPDNKIYMALLGDTSLSVIDNPNVYGNGCNFLYNKIFLGQNDAAPVQFGLPNFIQSYFNPLSNPYDFIRTGNCADRNVLFKINRLYGIDSVKWDFGDGQTSRALSPANKYFGSGVFSVSLIVYKTDCSGLNDTIRKKIWIADSIALLGSDIVSCNFENLKLGINVNVPGINYLWNTGSTDNKIAIITPGQYWIETEYKGCTLSDTINIGVRPKPYVNIGNDTTVCLNESIVLSARNTTANSYLWSTGETSKTIKINTAGQYSVAVTENNCTVKDSVTVEWGNCPFFIPNAFTPNKDGHNDYFGILNNTNFQELSIKIYNRYGEVIFSTNNITEKWDGTYKGKAMPVGAYSWSVVYINNRGYTKWLNGSVLIIR